MIITLALWLASLAVPAAPLDKMASVVGLPGGAIEAPQPASFQRCGYEILAEYPHDRTAFTQGLFWHDGHLYEGTGQYGKSRIARVDLESGKADVVRPLAPSDFGEGITRWKDQIIGVTWQGGIGYRWRLKDLKPLGSFRFEGEGWGVAMVGDELALSDGTSNLRFLNPETMAEIRRVTVSLAGRPLKMINELEWIDGKIWANIWMTDAIVRISPDDGRIDQLVDFTGLRQKAGAMGADSVLNGIAWDEKGQRLFITGKNWPKLYQINVVNCTAAAR